MDLNYPTLWPAGGPRGHPRVRTVDVKNSSQTGDRTETGRLFGTHLASNPPTKLVLGSVASMDLTHPMTSPTNAPWDLTRL